MSRPRRARPRSSAARAAAAPRGDGGRPAGTPPTPHAGTGAESDGSARDTAAACTPGNGALADDARDGEPGLPPLHELLTRHLPGLKGFIRARMNGLLAAKESSNDLVQSVCREVIEHIDRFEHQSEDGFRQWLYRTAERKTIDRLRYYTAAKRHAGREARLVEEGGEHTGTRPLFPSPSREAMAREELARAQAAFESLPEDYQTVIVLFRVQGLSHAEIAQRMGRSEGAVRNLLYRGLAAITDALDGGAR